MPDVNQTLDDRGKKYGEFPPLAAVIQAFKSVARAAPSWPRMTAVQREAIDMTFVKLARSLYGDNMLMDNWHDIAGYAVLATEEFARPGQMAPAENPVHPNDMLGKEPTAGRLEDFAPKQ